MFFFGMELNKFWLETVLSMALVMYSLMQKQFACYVFIFIEILLIQNPSPRILWRVGQPKKVDVLAYNRKPLVMETTIDICCN